MLLNVVTSSALSDLWVQEQITIEDFQDCCYGSFHGYNYDVDVENVKIY